ncbi:MAG: TonB-dependent receptor [Bacteroidetes bacterium]|nr:TonB-dependent receptor [Bacteroidota bacterium]
MKKTSMLTVTAIYKRYKIYLLALKLVTLLLLVNVVPFSALAATTKPTVKEITEGTQKQKISGIITDVDTKDPLIGVTVSVVSSKGVKYGTVTDINGKYSLDVSDKNATLFITYIGYEKQEIKLGTNLVVNIQLKSQTTKLNEVVVIGYGKSRRGDLTSAQTTVSAKDIEKTVNTTIEQAIQGRAAGVYVTQNSGQPGGGISINIRGVSSINGSTEPLYVVDGVQVQGQSVSNSSNLAGLNPADIEDIQILQGPSATAVYGSRATNGVVLITTKRGKSGDAKIVYNEQYSIQAPPHHLDVMNLRQYAQMVNEFHAIAGGKTPAEFMDPTLLGNGTDWQRELFKNTPMDKHQLSVSGGNDKTTYYLSGEYLDQKGVALGSGFKRYGFRLNVDNKPREWMTLGANLSFNETNSNLATSQGDVIANALQLTPQVPVKNFDGTWAGGDITNGANQFAPVNPIAIANLTTNTNINRQFLGGLNLGIKLMKGLDFRTTFNTNVGYTNSTYYQPTYSIGWAINATANLNNGTSVNTYWNWNQLLEYNTTIGKHSFDLMASHEAQASDWKNVGASRTGFLTNDIFDLNAGDPTTANNSGGSGTWGMESYLGRLSYNYGSKYLVVATVRRDGSSNFGSQNQWGIFPSLSAAWRISSEKFFNVPFISDMKLRFETGTTGNQGSGGIYSPMSTGATPTGTGFLPSQYSNPGLKWEETKTNNIGLNVAFLKNRIQLEFDYFVKKTDNLLMNNPLPWYMGTNGTGSVGAPTVNLGSLQNKGWGVTLNTTNIVKKDFKWESNLNVSVFNTKILQFYSDKAFVERTSWWMSNWTQRSSVGEAPWLFRGYIEEGLFKSIDEINKSAVPVDNTGKRLPTDATNGVWVGDVKYKDISGPNGKPDGIIDSYDMTNIGNPWPKLYGGFTNTFTYKGFELSILVTGTFGNDIYNYLASVNSNPNNINLSRNLLINAMDYAKPILNAQGDVVLANPNTNVARISYGPNGNYTRLTNKWVENGSFVRIKNISFSYNLPESLISKIKVIKGARLTLSAQNVATLTGYKGYDPEVGSYVGSNTYAGNQAIGVDYGRYPLTAVYTFNLGVNF